MPEHYYFSQAGRTRQATCNAYRREHQDRDVDLGLLELANKVIADEGGQKHICPSCEKLFVRTIGADICDDYCDFCNGVAQVRRDANNRIAKLYYQRKKEARAQ